MNTCCACDLFTRLAFSGYLATPNFSDEVGPRQGMPPFALGFSSVAMSMSFVNRPSCIVCMSHSFEMVSVDTTSVATSMIHLLTLGNLPKPQMKRETMGKPDPPIHLMETPTLSITVPIPRSRPLDTPVRKFNSMIRKHLFMSLFSWHSSLLYLNNVYSVNVSHQFLF